jgi:hypothetical protein
VVGVLIRMKVVLLRSTTTAERGAWIVAGATAGVLLAAGTILLSLWPRTEPGLVADLLAAVYLSWAVGWILGPLRASAPLLCAEHFVMLPIPRRRLAAGLLTTAFVGVGAPVTLLALLSLMFYAGRLGIATLVVAVPAVVLQLTVLVTLSRLAEAMFGRVARVRTGAALSGVLTAMLMVLAQSGWMLVVGLAMSGVVTDGLPDHWSAALRVVPSGWGLTAVEAADEGAWLLAAGALGGMAGLVAAALAVSARALGRPRPERAMIRGPRRPRPIGRRGTGAVGAVLGKELRTWWRDPGRTGAIVGSVTWGLATAALPLVFGETAMLPWAAPMIAAMAATSMANLYGDDGTAIWLTIQTTSERADVRARQWAYLAVFAPITVAIAVGSTLWSRDAWAWPWVLALLGATLGGGTGLIAWCSVHMPSPGIDHRRDRPVEHADEQIGTAFVVFCASLVPPLPAAGLLVLGSVRDDRWIVWSGVAVGIATGVLVAWGLGRAAARHLAATSPELLLLMRAGRAVAPAVDPDDRRSDHLRQTLAWTVGSLALFAQGLVPVVLKLTGSHDVRVWFLGMYLPEPFGWITAVVMIGVGMASYGLAVADLRRTSTRRS